MTFKDASVLQTDEYDDDQILENIEMQSSFKQRMQLRKKQQAKAGGPRGYNGTGD